MKPARLTAFALATLCVCVLWAPSLAVAQARTTPPRVGVLSPFIGPDTAFFETMRHCLEKLGYVEGRNIAFIYRAAWKRPGRSVGVDSRRAWLRATRHSILWVAPVAVLGAAAALGAPALAESNPPAAAPLAAAQLASLDLRPYQPEMSPPELSLRTPEGRTVSVAALRGRVVLLNFWATWCLECRSEMPALEVLHRRFGPRGLAVVGVNSREGQPAVAKYARELRLTFPMLLDPDAAVTGRYVIGLPTTFLLGRNGRAVALAVGARDWTKAAAVDIVETLLAAPAEPGRPGARP